MGRARRSDSRSSQARRIDHDPPAPLDRCFLAALREDFLHHGAAVIARVREEDPLGYLKLCASMVPKTASDAADPLEQMGDDELLEQARKAAAQIGLALAANTARTARKNEA